jgi:RND family efflux transporter MFP subunit
MRVELMSALRFCAIVVVFIAAFPAATFASPMVVAVGNAQATLQLTPDPPQTGRTTAVLTLTGASPEALAHTTASFSSSMPSMAMSGPSGTARAISPGHWQFDVSMAMAAAWNISVRFSGGVNGVAVYRFAVSGTDGAGATSGMAGMSSASGNPDAWKYATIALTVILAAALVIVVVRRDQRPLTLGIVLGAALVVAGLAAVQAKYAAPAMDMTAMSSVQGTAPTPVTLAAVRSTGNDPEIHAPGTIAPYLTQDVVTRAPGILRNFTLYAGDKVAAGQVVASLDAPDLQSRAAAAAADAAGQAATAQAAEVEAQHHAPNAVVIAHAETAALQRDLSAAEADRSAKAEQVRYWQNEVRREKTLLDQGAVSVQEYQDEIAQAAGAQSAYVSVTEKVGSVRQQIVASQTKATDAVASVSQMQAEAAAARAQARKAKENAATEATLAGFTTITSPDDAIVVKRLVDPGVYVQAGTAIARIAVVRRLRVQANVAQEDLLAVRIGAPVDARLADGTVVHGRVSSVSPVADAATHTAAVEAIVENAKTGLVPGGFVQVTLHARQRWIAGGVQVPSSAVVGAGADAAVWTDVNGTAHRVPVHLIADDGSDATVTGDLDRRAHVVLDGAATLEEGQAIVEQRS